MKKTVLERYENTDDGRVIVDVSVGSVEELYNDFDKRAPYHRKELDEEFVEYLSDCVREIGRQEFMVRVSLERMPGEELAERAQKSINGYYEYLKEVELRAMRVMFRRFGILFAMGLSLLVLAILATRSASINKGFVGEVFAQGLTIAAWVSLWEAFVYVFLDWRPHRENIRLYERIIDAEVEFASRIRE
jgi:hypothetical protein